MYDTSPPHVVYKTDRFFCKIKTQCLHQTLVININKTIDYNVYDGPNPITVDSAGRATRRYS